MLCEMIQATQLISFRFDQSPVSTNKSNALRVQDLKRLDSISGTSYFDCEHRYFLVGIDRKVSEIINKVRQYGKKVFFI